MTEITAIKMPKWGLSMEEGTVTDWLVGLGDEVSPGVELIEIETTKITNVLEAYETGVVRRQLAQVGQLLNVGDLLGVIAGVDTADEDIENFIANFSPEEALDEEGSEAPAPTFLSRYVQTSYGDVRVLESNTESGKSPFVLLHGFSADAESWALIQPELAQDRPVYSIELIGHGQSTKTVGAGALEDMSRAAIEAMAALEVSDFYLAGHSLGGAVAVHIAANMTPQVKGLGLISPAALQIGDMPRTYIEGFVKAKRARDLKTIAPLLFHKPEHATRSLMEDLIKSKRLDGALEAVTLIKDGLLGGDAAYAELKSTCAALGMNVVIVVGQDDPVVGPFDKDALPSSGALIVLDNAAHMAQFEQPREVISALRSLVD